MKCTKRCAASAKWLFCLCSHCRLCCLILKSLTGTVVHICVRIIIPVHATMIDLAMIAPSKETASKGHLHDLLIHRSFFQHNQCKKKTNSKSTMTQIYSETIVGRVLDYRQKLFPSGDWLPIPTRSDRVKLTFANWDYCKKCDHFSCLPFCGK